MAELSIDFTPKIAEVHGQLGSEWLEKLPAVLADCAQRWSLTFQPPFANLSYNYVVPATQDGGREVVLKAGVPVGEFVTEHDALVHFDGSGMVRLLDADLKLGLLLLERLSPGTPLRSMANDDRVTQIAAGVMVELWKPAPAEHSFPTVTDWSAGLQRLHDQFDDGYGPYPPHLVDKAESLFSELIDSMAEPVLLHGDLHHDNILMSDRQPWIGIDPKGIIGEPSYEVGAFLRNIPINFEDGQAKYRLARAVDQLCEQLQFDRERIVKWGIAQAVLSAWWSFEDHGNGWEPALAWAKLFESIE